jgi:DUF1365 family protein
MMHHFKYRIFMLYLDLGEAEQWTAKGLISHRRFAAASFLRRDHLRNEPAETPLDDGVRDLVQRRTGSRPSGPIRLLTQLRYCGHFFSPLNVYYCFDAAGRHVESVVGEVNNTPWGEQHTYVLWAGNRVAAHGPLQFRHAKNFHVSPFMDMKMRYHWTLREPSNWLTVGITTVDKDGDLFHAAMALRRQPLQRRQLRRVLWRYPLMNARIVAAIYHQAFKLWWKKCPFYPHPKTVAITEPQRS